MKLIFKLSIIVAALLLHACQGTKKAEKKEGKQTITVTIEPQRYFIEAIAGDKFDVVCMVPKGSSPETYDPTPKQLVEMNKSHAYFRIGHIGFEQVWMDRLIENAPHTQVFDLSQGVDLIYEMGHQHGDHYHEGGVEPHIWNSALNAKVIAENIFSALCTLDKEHEAYYMARYDSLVHRVEHTDNTIRTMLNDEKADSAFIIYHPALSYFAREYNLQQISIEEDGKEPSPAHLKNLIELSKAKGVRVIFVQPEFDQRNAEIIARETGTTIVPINPLSYEWEEEMIHVAKSLTR